MAAVKQMRGLTLPFCILHRCRTATAKWRAAFLTMFGVGITTPAVVVIKAQHVRNS